MTQEIRDAQKDGAFASQSPAAFLKVLRAHAEGLNKESSIVLL